MADHYQTCYWCHIRAGPGRFSTRIKVRDTKGLSPCHPYNEMTMANTRNYTDAALRQMISDLSEGQKTMLRVGGALPKDPLGELYIDLRGSDVSRMIELIEEAKA
jgi:hypothetical protein